MVEVCHAKLSHTLDNGKHVFKPTIHTHVLCHMNGTNKLYFLRIITVFYYESMLRYYIYVLI